MKLTHRLFSTSQKSCALISAVQTLGISDSTPRSESRLKSLFWPDVENGSDVDYLGAQGYWICMLVAVVGLTVSVVTGHPIGGVLVLLYFYLGGCGVRERSRYAAAAVFVMYGIDTLISGLGVVRVLFAALLLSNLRATWIAAGWKPASEEAFYPQRLSDTWGDKFADRLPAWLWPKVRILYYVFSAAFLLLTCLGVIRMLSLSPPR